MSVHLRVSKLRELEALLAVLTAPLDHAGAEEWLDAVNRAVVTFFEAEGVMSLLFREDDEPWVRFHRVDPAVARQNREILVGAGDGTLRLSYRGVDLMLRRLAAAGVRVWTPELAARLTGMRLEEMAYTHEVAIPGGIYHQANMAVPLQVGVAQISFFHGSPDQDPFGEDRLALLELICPAFRSGVGALRTFERGRAALGEQFGLSSAPILVFDRGGSLLYRNEAARPFLAEEASGLTEVARRLAVRLFELHARPRKSGSAPPRLVGEDVGQYGGARSRVSATFVPPGMIHRDGAVVVRVERLTPALPASRTIQQRLGLTPRQAEVARLIARGWTNPEVADELGISVHTARRHAEAILFRLGLRSRAGVGARLMSLAPSD